jgi:hypothetical protein
MRVWSGSRITAGPLPWQRRPKLNAREQVLAWVHTERPNLLAHAIGGRPRIGVWPRQHAKDSLDRAVHRSKAAGVVLDE